MIKELFFEAKTIDDAKNKAAAELGLDADLMTYEVVTMPQKGIFGIGAVNAKIKVEQEVPDPVKPAPAKKPVEFVEKIAKKDNPPKKPAAKKNAKKLSKALESMFKPIAYEAIPPIDEARVSLQCLKPAPPFSNLLPNSSYWSPKFFTAVSDVSVAFAPETMFLCSSCKALVFFFLVLFNSSSDLINFLLAL